MKRLKKISLIIKKKNKTMYFIIRKKYLKWLELKSYIKSWLGYNFCNRRKYIEIMYQKRTNKKLNLDNPKTFNDKLNWLKLYWYDPIAYKCVDKYRVREVVKERGYENLLNTLYAVYDNPKDINWDELPNEFILKANNGCGNHIICKDKDKLDKKKAFKTLRKNLYRNYAVLSAEWPYEKVKPKIICEKLLEENGKAPTDYKIFCCNGKPLFLYVATDREKKTKFDFFDINFKMIPVKQQYDNSEFQIKKPKNYDEMLEIASKLSQGLPFVRVDFYNINGKIIFGEYTFFHMGGRHEFVPDKYNYIFGNMIELPPKMKTPFIKE